MKYKGVLLSMLFVFALNQVYSQNLRKFGLFFGGYIPDLSINVGLNYKVIDNLEVETQFSYYKYNTIGLNIGSKYFFHMNEITEKEIHSIAIGLSFEQRSSVKVSYAVDNLIMGTYKVGSVGYIYPNVGYRYYAKSNKGTGFIKEAYFFPNFGYMFPTKSGNPYLTDGISDDNIERKISKYSKGGFNLMIRAGFVF